MKYLPNRRQFIETTVAAGLAAGWTDVPLTRANESERGESKVKQFASTSNLVVNDDAEVFLWLREDLSKDDLRRYLATYCRPGVSTVAFCVGDMTWPIFYPTKVGTHYSTRLNGNDDPTKKGFKNVQRFESEPGGYYGATFEILHQLGKKILASFRMNDAHYASNPKNPYTSDFWRQHQDLTLGSKFGYFGGSLNYAHKVVRDHFVDLVIEFMELYPQVDGIELDTMRSPYFFPADHGQENALLFTEVIHRIKAALAKQAKRLNRVDYSLSIILPRTPGQALDWGLDAASWDAEKLFDFMAVGPYQADVTTPVAQWKAILNRNTPVYSYVNVAPRSNGDNYGLKEYRAAAANGYGGGADGMYLFNFPYLVAAQSLVAGDVTKHSDPTKIGQVLEEVGRSELLHCKDKRFLFYINTDSTYRQFAPILAGMNRRADQPSINAPLLCYEDCQQAREVKLRFKLENVARTEQFRASLNGRPINLTGQIVRFIADGRKSQAAEDLLGPYLEYQISLMPNEIRKGENMLAITPIEFERDQNVAVNLREIELEFAYS
jgi:hypothetical protein